MLSLFLYLTGNLKTRQKQYLDMSKGITPVLATILLMSVTIAAAGTLYTMVENNVNKGQDSADRGLPVNMDSLKVEACYKDNSNSLIDIRNTARNTINASEVAVVLNGSIQDRSEYEIEPELVTRQRVFTVNISKDFGPETVIELSKGQQNLRHNCYNF